MYEERNSFGAFASFSPLACVNVGNFFIGLSFDRCTPFQMLPCFKTYVKFDFVAQWRSE
jgi:hypothetical protein